MVGKFEQLMLLGMLFFIMLGMGAALTPKDFVLALKRPRALAIALVGQFGIMPLLGFLLAWALALPPAYALGLILMAAMPGGTTSNIFTYFARGNLALSVLATVNSTLFAAVLTPVAVLGYTSLLFSASEVRLPAENLVASLVVLLVPVLIGMALRRWNANLGAMVELAGSALGILFILVLIVTWVPRNYALLAAAPVALYAGAIGLGWTGFAAGYGFSRLLGLSPRDANTVSLEIGIQNGPLAIGIVLLSFSGTLQQDVLFVPALYALFIVLSASALTVFYRRMNMPRGPAAAALL